MIDFTNIFNKIHRHTPCNLCKGELVETKLTTQVFMDGSEDTIYEERCVQCGNLLYGWVKKTKQATVELMPIKENANI